MTNGRMCGSVMTKVRFVTSTLMHVFSLFVEHFTLLATIVFYAYILFVVGVIIMENRDTGSTLAWILVLILLPVVGFLLYIFFGRHWRVHSVRKQRRITQLQKKSLHALLGVRAVQKERMDAMIKKHASAAVTQTLRVVQDSPDALLTLHNTIKVFQRGQDKFHRLKADIRAARTFVHMEYFIWRADPLTQEIANVLIAKVAEGVTVRVLYDPIGSLLTTLRHPTFFRRMRRAGVQVVPFFNLLSPFKITTINYILHHKIVVIDGVIAYTGGMNMAQEYIDGGKRFASWRDTHLRLTGECVLALHATFARNWEQATKESLFDVARYFPLPHPPSPGKRHVPISVLSTQPMAYWQPIANSLLMMILAARHSVYIQSPYFIPDESLYNALKMIALTGVDVRIMVTGVPDKRLPYWAALTYFEGLLLAGVKVYHYMDGFLHAKTVVVDGAVCAIGTTNLDIRSLYLSHENNLIVYDEVTAKELERDFMRDLAACARFSFGSYTRIGRLAKMRNSVARLLSPLM